MIHDRITGDGETRACGLRLNAQQLKHAAATSNEALAKLEFGKIPLRDRPAGVDRRPSAERTLNSIGFFGRAPRG